MQWVNAAAEGSLAWGVPTMGTGDTWAVVLPSASGTLALDSQIPTLADLLSDGDKGDVVVSSSGTVWTADFLKSQNFAVQIAHNDYHFWLRCEGYVIDLTATQFGHINPILIQPITIETEYHWYEKPIVLENLTAEYFQQIKWPDEQNPFYYETEKQID